MTAAPLVQFKLMLPADLKERVAASANANHRSLSQEIVATLEEKYPAPIEDYKAQLAEILALFDKRLSGNERVSIIADTANNKMAKMSEADAQRFAFELLSSLLSDFEAAAGAQKSPKPTPST